MKTSERQFKHVKQIWDSYMSHPFILGLNDGTLDIEKFKFYLTQDYLYLLDYTKVFALGIVKSKKEEHMQLFGDMVQMIINSETDTHKSYLDKLNMTREAIFATPTSLTTESYTKYMLSEAFEGGLAEITTAVLACSWSYKYIADNMDKNADHGFYAPWVEAYASDDYTKGNDIIINLLDELTKDYTEEQLSYLDNIIWNCSRYEGMFWDMAWNMEF